MKFLETGALLVLSAAQALAATQWGFTDATVSVSAKGAGVGSGTKAKFAADKPLIKPIDLSSADTLKVLLTTQEGKDVKRPHQAFLSLKNPSGLETSFPLTVKENGKAKLDLQQKDIPPQLLRTSGPLSASVVVGSFGSSAGSSSPVFNLNIQGEATAKDASGDSERYGKLPEIHHIFKADPKSPPTIVTLFFTAIVLGSLGALLVAWLALGGNFSHLPKALQASPIGHVLYFGSIVLMQGVFFLYYSGWNLFQTLPIVLAVGAVTLFAGSRALTEVQERRLTAQR